MAIKFSPNNPTRLVLTCFMGLLFPLSASFGQQNQSSTNTNANSNTDNRSTVIIIEETKSADGKTTVKKTVRSESNMSEADVQKLLSEEMGEDVRVIKQMDGDSGVEVHSASPATKKENKAWLGVMIENADSGVRITEVIEDAPAQKSGLKGGDIITAVNGNAVSDMESLLDQLASFAPGDKVEVTYLRDGISESKSISLGKREPSPFEKSREVFSWDDHVKDHSRSAVEKPKSKPRLGVSVEVSDDLGLLVTKVSQQSVAEKYGLREGDILVSFDGTDLKEYDDLLNAVRKAPAQEKVKVIYLREGKKKKLKLQFDE